MVEKATLLLTLLLILLAVSRVTGCATDNCTSYEQFRNAEILKRILDAAGLKEIPTFTSEQQEEVQLIRRNRGIMADYEQQIQPDPEQEYSYIEGIPFENNSTQKGALAIFNYQDILRHRHISAVDLLLYLPRGGISDLYSSSVVRVYAVKSNFNWTDDDLLTAWTFKLAANSETIVPIHAHLVREWLDGDVIGLYVEVVHMTGYIKVVAKIADNTKNSNMLLGIRHEAKIHDVERRRRNTHNKEKSCSNKNPLACCLRDFTINFKKLGWDSFILAPAFYNAHACRGDCNHWLGKKNPHQHTSQDYDMGNRCCHPTEFSDLKVMFIVNTYEVKIVKVPDMVAKRCTCS